MPEVSSGNGDEGADDETLVRLARTGDDHARKSARESLFQKHRGMAYRVAYRQLGNEQDALDAVQDGMLKAFLGLDNFDGRSVFRTWLVRIINNAAIDLGRKRGRRAFLGTAVGFGQTSSHGDEESQQPDPALDDDPSRGLHRQDQRRVLDTALSRLSLPVRTTFILFAEAELSYHEIAEELKVPIGTVMSRIHYARQKLKSLSELQGIE
jgi:RNA polymerase sigma-70 factor (ECF subfamily)